MEFWAILVAKPASPGLRIVFLRLKNAVLGFVSSSPIEMQFVNFTRFLTIFLSPLWRLLSHFGSKNRSSASQNRVFGAESDLSGFISTTTIEMQFVDLTRLLCIFCSPLRGLSKNRLSGS